MAEVRDPAVRHGELLARIDYLRNLAQRRQHKLDTVLDLIRDAESSGRTTVLCDNLRRAIGEH